MSDSRRSFLRHALAAAALSACGPASRVVQPRRSASELPPPRGKRPPPVYTGRPHYVVEIFLGGGFDSVLTVDPKDQNSVGDGIDCGYRADQRVQGGRRLFGPLIGDLMKHDADLCLVHGVRVDTVSHPDGAAVIASGKLGGEGKPFANVAAKALPGGAAIPVLQVACPPKVLTTTDGVPKGDLIALPAGGGPSVGFTTSSFLRSAEQLRSSGVPWRQLQEIAKQDAARAAGGDSKKLEAMEQQIRAELAVVDLMDRATLPAAFDRSILGEGLSIALDAISANVASYIKVASALFWFDSHTDNFSLQQQRTLPALDDLAAFLDMLRQTRNQFGPLIDQTTVVVLSELGRFPKLNHALGKDHFPENSWILAGRGVRGGTTVGETSRSFQGLPINHRSGRADRDGRPITVESMFATLLAVIGVDPSAHGYRSDQVITCIQG